jgi:hypothetical protein
VGAGNAAAPQERQVHRLAHAGTSRASAPRAGASARVPARRRPTRRALAAMVRLA